MVSEYDRVHTRDAWTLDGVVTEMEIPHGVADKVGQARINVPEIVKFVRAIGDIVVSRMYADWSREVFASYRPTIAKIRPRNLIQATSGQGLLDLDLQIARDVLRDLQLHGDITDVVVIAGTTGFEGLGRLGEHPGRRLHGIGVANARNTRWQQTCHFTGYRDLTPALPDAAPPPWVAPLIGTLREVPGNRCLMSELKDAIRRHDPGFDESNWFFKSVGALVNLASTAGTVLTEDDDQGRPWVRLPDDQAATG